ncbi:MAG TPA: metalloregulator ArsR/SmtB family transcription factor [Nocardioidaceae bacterium]|nr:metalloregulator ArsR/SmtB family transcription factor [Nocardioidaceae bacterium]
MAILATSAASQTVETEALDSAAALFRALGDPNRLAILQHLALGEHRVVDLTEHLGLAQSTVSKHLACLRDCGLVTSRPQGRASMFRLTQTDAAMELLAAAERLLALTGDAVRLCPTYADSTPTEAGAP